jgi:hypothetical protein
MAGISFPATYVVKNDYRVDAAFAPEVKEKV